MKVGNILNEALTVINSERLDMYGNPENSFQVIADYWTNYINSEFNIEINIKPNDVAMMMVLLKIARESNQHKKDNYLDAAGYLGIAYDMINKSNEIGK